MTTDIPVRAFTSCDTCLAIRRDWRKSDTWLGTSYWRTLCDEVPTAVLLDMTIAELHTIHHLGGQQYADAVIFAGIRVLVDWAVKKDADMVPSQEMREALARASDQYHRELNEITATAKEKAREELGAQLREARTRIANVEALVSVAFRAKHKKMDYAEVRDAIDWRTGYPSVGET